MAKTIESVMSGQPVSLAPKASVREAAEQMRSQDIGDVLVCDGDKLLGIVTDRDIVVRAVAEGHDVSSCTVGDICSGKPTTVSPTTSVDEAASMMRERAIRRLPVVDGGKVVGVVSIGDLAVEADGESALADISAAPPNS
jgi:CBS domain-containing protein